MKLTPFMALCIAMGYAIVVLIAVTAHINLRFKEHEKKFHAEMVSTNNWVVDSPELKKLLDNP